MFGEDGNKVEARWYIDAYTRRDDRNAVLLELAKLDYNMVQAAHQIDMINISRWWKNLDLPKQLPFVARDRLVECFLWTSGVVPEPQYKMSREAVTKLTTLVTVIDDVYDIYATLDEVKLFTNAIERWDVNAVEELPDYMKLCYMAIFNTTNEIGYDILKEQNSNAETERGDVLKSVQCYMHNNGVTEEVAREYIRQLADEAWKKMNAELWVDSRSFD
ncbi:Isoprene synthase protein [Thalictrum thalictroides]|uniref:Isoprene synthase protein n=1 Tax=Thalictrum thalictroides TaxID=46969 RepID=A0A7J6XAJ9_THATH|nr:Isoprene synthase protein [Thalictrum thalictroides]